QSKRKRVAPSAVYLPAGFLSLCLKWRMSKVVCQERICHGGLELQAGVTPRAITLAHSSGGFDAEVLN
ncbi:MAG TPA: hypothetical protein VK731_11755, partial [Candidatus Cybelea sp.]|nr:hypothetical protein [Candidatus Cybelea sp.]